jgi:XTP/dITP diphosphohydrolase
MHTLIFATNNAHKVAEIQPLMPADIKIVTLKEAGIDREIPEPHPTLEENAAEKSGVIHDLTGLDCFSEDTGLEVDALNGEPGVKSARYAGEPVSHAANIELLLKNLKEKQDLRARFRTIISLRWRGGHYFFEGICSGTIQMEKSGEKGFGYDPIYVPKGADRTFAEMSLEEKSKYSHRAKAVEKLVGFLRGDDRGEMTDDRREMTDDRGGDDREGDGR